MNKILATLALIICLAGFRFSVSAQSGGNNTFEFLNLVSYARPAALGGNAIVTKDDDITLVYQNPALLTRNMHQQIAFSYVSYFSQIKFGDFAYAHDMKKLGMYAFNVHFVDYGTFNRTDESSNVIGTVKAGEYAFSVSWSKPLSESFTIGSSVKGIFSNLGDISSNGIAADVGLNWFQKEKLWSASLVMKNAGVQLKKYEDSEKEKLPFEIQVGIAKRLLKAPFRFSLIAQQLQQFDLSYKDPFTNTTDPVTGNIIIEEDNNFQKAVNHLIFNAEILFTKNFNVRVGYNFLRRNELALNEKKGLSGISLGLGLKVNRFNFSYAYAKYVPFSASNHFTIATNFAEFKKKSTSN